MENPFPKGYTPYRVKKEAGTFFLVAFIACALWIRIADKSLSNIFDLKFGFFVLVGMFAFPLCFGMAFYFVVILLFGVFEKARRRNSTVIGVIFAISSVVPIPAALIGVYCATRAAYRLVFG